jgi:hypothetical protein
LIKIAEIVAYMRRTNGSLPSESRGPWIGPDICAQHAPVGTELECHHDHGYDAKTKRDAKNLEPELQERPTGSAGCGQIKRLGYGEPGGQADRESWKDDVK